MSVTTETTRIRNLAESLHRNAINLEWQIIRARIKTVIKYFNRIAKRVKDDQKTDEEILNELKQIESDLYDLRVLNQLYEDRISKG